MPGHDVDNQPPKSRSGDAQPGASPTPGKHTRVEQGQAEEAGATGSAADATGSATAAPSPGRPSLQALFGARRDAAAPLPRARASAGQAPTSGPGPRTGLGAKAGPIARARSPRELQRVVPPAVLAQHGLAPPPASADVLAALPRRDDDPCRGPL